LSLLSQKEKCLNFHLIKVFSTDSFVYWKMTVERTAQFQIEFLDIVSVIQTIEYMQYVAYDMYVEMCLNMLILNQLCLLNKTSVTLLKQL
jgi:hypothetical protein